MRQYETELDSHYQTLPFWEQLDESSAYLALTAFDSLVLPTMAALRDRNETPATVQIRKRMEDGIVQTFRWLHRAGKHNTLLPTSSIARIDAAGHFLFHAADYSDIADLHMSYNRGLASVRVNPEVRCVRFDTVDDTQGIFGGACYEESVFEELGEFRRRRSRLDHSRIDELLRAVVSVPHKYEAGRIVLSRPDHLAGDALDQAMRLMWPADACDVSDSTDLGGFSAEELNLFWSSLSRWSLSALHLYFEAVFHGQPQNRCMPTQVVESSDFLDQMSSLASLRRGTVELILNRLTLGESAPKPELLLQPIVRSGQRIAWSVVVVLASRFQRNMLKLMARQPASKVLADKLIGGREADMLREFGRFMAKHGYQFCLRKPVGDRVDGSEIDFLGWTNQAPNQILLVQWKAVLRPDAINEVDYVTDRFLEGQQQAERCISLLKTMPRDRRRELFRFVPWERVTEFFATVLSRDTGPNQRYDHAEIPASSFATMRVRLRQSDYKTPARFWTTLRDRAWLRALHEGCDHLHKPISVGCIKYELPALRVVKRQRDSLSAAHR